MEESFSPLTEVEEETLITLLLKLFQSTRSQDIKRVAKSLFGLLTQQRFTPSENKPIKF